MSAGRKHPGQRRTDQPQPKPPRSDEPAIVHVVAQTNRLDRPELEGEDPLPEELTGRASGTAEDLAALFDNDTPQHLADGFRGGSADDPAGSTPAKGAEPNDS
jgi:hypothetical protein